MIIIEDGMEYIQIAGVVLDSYRYLKDIKDFCNANDIDIDNITENEKNLIEMNIDFNYYKSNIVIGCINIDGSEEEIDGAILKLKEIGFYREFSEGKILMEIPSNV